jgi:cytoskeletal protein CcmA (bactofilin family)
MACTLSSKRAGLRDCPEKSRKIPENAQTIVNFHKTMAMRESRILLAFRLADSALNNISQKEGFFYMWKPTNQPTAPGRPTEPERTPTSAPSAPAVTETAASAPRPVTASTADQATIGKSLVIKGEVTGSESLYIDGRVEGSINLAGNRVTVGRNGVVAANINAREIVVLGKVRGNLTASDRVDIRSDGSLTGDVVAARISIEDGAFFKGGIDIRKGGQAGQKPNGEDKPAVTSSTEAVAARA